MIFLDTSAFLALENRKDECHEPAMIFRDSLFKSKESFVTSDYVLDESYTIIRLRAGHKIAVQFGEMIQATGLIEIKYLTKEILREAWQIFKSFSDKEFSFTDCTSFALMESLQIKKAFTFDDHFKQYGKFETKPSV
jgi:predicted nucleic acid-binding protein